MACTEREGEGRKRKAFGEDMSGSGVSKRERQGEGESCRVEKPEREFDGVCQKRKAAKTRIAELLESDRQYREADAEYFRLNDAFLKEQAGILALELEEARPCPVCGSLRHPAPAQVSGDAPSQQDVRAARKERDKREKEKDTLQNAFVLKRQECKVQEERLQDEGKRILGEAFDLSEESLLENLKGRVAVLENAGSEYSRQMQEIEEEVRRWEEFRAVCRTNLIGKRSWREVEESLAALQAGIHVRKGEQKSEKEAERRDRNLC